MDKLEKLKLILKKMGSVLVAYSGGVDSTLLLKVACQALPGKVLAVTANSPTYPAEELKSARIIAAALGVKHKIIKTQELKDKKFVANSINRCYFCKRALFAELNKISRREKINFVVDASNISDKKDFRPGDKAKRELHIRSPLQEAGLNKEDIRKLSRKLGLATWDKPSLACLASRLPYGISVKPELLARINKGENFLRSLGLKQVRLRHYNGLCRIEVLKKDIPRLIGAGDLVLDRLKKLGYDYVTIDLEGYRTGSMNEGIIKSNIKYQKINTKADLLVCSLAKY